MHTKLLLDLQTLDLQRDELVAQLRHVLSAMRGDAKLRAARELNSASEVRLSDLERDLRQQTAERLRLQARIQQEEEKLYGGRISSPKDLQNLQRETAALKRQMAEVEDRVLVLLLDRDEVTAALAAARSALVDAEQQLTETRSSLTDEKARLAGSVRRLDGQRERITAAIQPNDLALYDRLRAAKGGRAVAVLRGESCAACGMQLPGQDLHRLRTGQVHLLQCSGCGRIVHG